MFRCCQMQSRVKIRALGNARRRFKERSDRARRQRGRPATVRGTQRSEFRDHKHCSSRSGFFSKLLTFSVLSTCIVRLCGDGTDIIEDGTCLLRVECWFVGIGNVSAMLLCRPASNLLFVSALGKEWRERVQRCSRTEASTRSGL